MTTNIAELSPQNMVNTLIKLDYQSITNLTILSSKNEGYPIYNKLKHGRSGSRLLKKTHLITHNYDHPILGDILFLLCNWFIFSQINFDSLEDMRTFLILSHSFSAPFPAWKIIENYPCVEQHLGNA